MFVLFPSIVSLACDFNKLPSPLAGGLSMNDFIVAAKIDRVKTSDLLPKKRVWA